MLTVHGGLLSRWDRLKLSLKLPWSQQEERKKRSPGSETVIRWFAAHIGVLCQLYICKQDLSLASSSLYLPVSPFLCLCAPHHHKLTGIYPWFELITHLTISCIRGGSWWHVSMRGHTQFQAGVICGDVCGRTASSLSVIPGEHLEKEAQLQIEDLSLSLNPDNDRCLNFLWVILIVKNSLLPCHHHWYEACLLRFKSSFANIIRRWNVKLFFKLSLKLWLLTFAMTLKVCCLP